MCTLSRSLAHFALESLGKSCRPPPAFTMFRFMTQTRRRLLQDWEDCFPSIWIDFTQIQKDDKDPQYTEEVKKKKRRRRRRRGWCDGESNRYALGTTCLGEWSQNLSPADLRQEQKQIAHPSTHPQEKSCTQKHAAGAAGACSAPPPSFLLGLFRPARTEPRLRKAMKDQQRPRPRYYVRGQTSPDVEGTTDVSSPANIIIKWTSFLLYFLFHFSLFSFPLFISYFFLLSLFSSPSTCIGF